MVAGGALENCPAFLMQCVYERSHKFHIFIDNQVVRLQSLRILSVQYILLEENMLLSHSSNEILAPTWMMDVLFSFAGYSFGRMRSAQSTQLASFLFRKEEYTSLFIERCLPATARCHDAEATAFLREHMHCKITDIVHRVVVFFKWRIARCIEVPAVQ